MELTIDNYDNYKFYVTLVSGLENFDTHKLDRDILVLNPDFIVSVFHIQSAIHRALFNFKIKKNKADIFAREIVHYTTDKGKVDQSVKMHKTNENGNYYLVFINKKKEDIDNTIKASGGNVISVDNYSKFVNFEKLIKEFSITEEEANTENGVPGAIYNKLALKDLK